MGNGTKECSPYHIYVCSACGKTSRTRYGFFDDGTRASTSGWDESCMMHAVLCYYPRRGDTWEAVPEEEAYG